jgi:hypothetical protein
MSTPAEEDPNKESERRSRTYRPVARSLNQYLGPLADSAGIMANFRAKITGQQFDEAQAHHDIRRVLEEGRHVHGGGPYAPIEG